MFSEIWTKEATTNLICLYIDKKNQQNRWNKISDELRKKNSLPVDGEKCRLKIKSLKEKYEKQKKQNDMSGSNPIHIDPILEEAFSVEGIMTENVFESSMKTSGFVGLPNTMNNALMSLMLLSLHFYFVL